MRSSPHPVLLPRRFRRGVALLVALFIILLLVVLGSTMVTSVDLHGKSTRNEVEALRVQQVADAGLTHALGIFHIQLADDPFNQLLRGADTTWNQGQGDDGILQGMVPFEIPEADAIPAAGLVLDGYRYQVRVTDDPADDNDPSTDSNQRLLVTCTATAANGTGGASSAVARAIVERSSSAFKVMVRGPTAVTNSGFSLTGGSCAQFYLDGEFVATSAAAKAVGGWQTTGSAIPSNFGPGGAARVTKAPALVIPSVTPAVACPAGTAFVPAPAAEIDVATISGIRCYTGSITVFGTSSSPKALTLVATGSITVRGVQMVAAHPSGYALIAGADIRLQDIPDGKKLQGAYVEGAMFCEGQVAMEGSSSTKNGFIYCQGRNVGSEVTQNTFATSGKMQGGCGGVTASIGIWRATSWYPGVGS